MKAIFTKLWIITLLMVAASAATASHLQSHLLFSARLDGAQEVPSVITDATGVATFTLNPGRDTLCITMSVQGLSGPITGVHIHEGLPDTTGGVLVDLVPFLSGNRVAGSLTGSTLTSDLIGRMLAGSVYINVHTDANPNGEIRGQITLEADASYVARLDGDQEVPPVVTDAKGLAIFSLSRNQGVLKVKVLARDLSGPIIGAHLHVGAPDTTGGVISDLTGFVSGFYIEGEVDPAAFLADLIAGNIYINIHTDLNPNGEIRGQVLRNPDLAFDSKLDGSQEVPPVTTDALGLFSARISYSLDTMWYYALARDLSGPITGAHFHEGDTGISGGVVTDLTASIIGNQLEGMITGTELTDDLINDLLSGNIYLNLHTDANPDGEIRGQVYRLGREGYTLAIDGLQEVPAVITDGSGFGMVSIDRDQTNAHFMMVFSGLSGPATGAHFHLGIPGETGGVLFDITPFLTMTSTSDAAFGYWKSTDATPFTVTNSIQFQSDSIYFNVHTTANPDGEIRGDVKRGANCFSITVGIENQNEASHSFDLYPNPVADQLTIDFAEMQQPVTEIRIYRIEGKLINSYKTAASMNTVNLDVQHLSSGIYLLSLKSGEQTIMKQFTKQ